MGRSDFNSSAIMSVRSESTNGDSRSTTSDNSDSYNNNMINQPELQRGKMSVSSMTKLTMNTPNSSNENNKPLKSSNSAQRLSQLKKRIGSLTLKSDSYRKIDTSSSPWNAGPLSNVDAFAKDRGGLRQPNRRLSSDLQPGVRRVRSCNDHIHSLTLHNAALTHDDEAEDSYHNHSRDVGAEAASKKYSDLIGNPQSADAGDNSSHPFNNAKNYSFLPDSLSSPSFPDRTAGTKGRTIPTFSKSSNKAVNDLLAQASAVAGRKHRKQSIPSAGSSSSANPSTRATALTRRSSTSTTSSSSGNIYAQSSSSSGILSSVNVYAQISRTAPVPGSSSSPHDLGGPNQRRNTSIDLTVYAKNNSNTHNLSRQPSSSTHTPRTVDDMGMRGRRSDGVDGVGGGFSRRRSKRLIPNETVVDNTNEPPRNDRERRKDLFREDFPDEPIPSNAILTRLYGNLNIPPPPPPPPYSNNMEERGSASNGSSPTSLASGLNKLLVKPPVISPEDLPVNSGHTSFTSHEWTCWKDSDEKPMRKKSAVDDTNRSELSSKSKHTNDDTRRSESSKSRNSTASSRRSSCNHRRDHSRRSRDHHARYSSKTLPHIRSSELSSSSLHKSKSSRRRDGLSRSAHGSSADGTYTFSPVSSPKRGRKRVDTIKNKSKASSRNTSHDGVSSSHGTPSRKSLHKASDHDTFQNAMLDLSNGSFVDSYSTFSEHKASTSLEILGALFNSSRSFNDSSKSFAECDEKTDKEPKKKRRGKRGGSVSSESKHRSKSADENRTGNTKGTRRGKRSIKSKVSTIDPKSNDEESLSLSKIYGEDSLEFESSLNDSRLNELGVKQRKSPKSISRKSLNNENGAKQRKSPKVLLKKEMSNRNLSKSPKVLLKKERSNRSLKSPRTMKKNTKGASVKSHASLTNSTRSSRSIERECVGRLSPSKDGAPKVASKEENKSGGNNFYDLAISSWVDISTETFQTEASVSSSSPKEKTHFSNNETPKRKDLARKTRYQNELVSTSNGMSPGSNADTAAARVPDVTTMNSTSPTTDDVPVLPKASKTLNFPLNFVEYENVSPLTVASKKMSRVDIHLMSSMACLEG